MVPLAGANRLHATLGNIEALDPQALMEHCAMRAGALGKRLSDVGRACLTIARQEARADEIIDHHQRPHRLDLGGREQLHVHAEASRRGGKALELGPAIVIAGKPEAAGHLPASGEPGLGFETAVEIDGIFQELGDRRRRPELTDEPGGMPGRARGELVLLEDDDVGAMIAGEVISSGAADDAAADHHDIGMARH